MFLNYLNFLKFLNYLKDYDCEENPYYENITNISDNKHGCSLVNSDAMMLNFENIRNNVFSKQKIIPSTVDGLYFNFSNKHSILSLYFIEFKGGEISNESFKYYINEEIIPLVNASDLNDEVVIEILNSYTNIVSTNLKLKPFESLFVIFPKICEEYARKNNMDFSIGEYYSFLLTKIRCHLIIVYESDKNHINDEEIFAADIRDKYKVLKNNGIVFDFDIFDEIDFQNNILNDIQEFPIAFLDIIIPVVENVLNESENPENFGKLIGGNLEKEINKSNLPINDNQREKLRKLCSVCCMNAINN